MYQQDFKSSEAGISERIAALAARESRYIGRVPTSSGVRGKDEDQRFSPLSVIDIDSASSFEIGNESRTLVCDWMYRIVDHYSLERETIPIGMSYFDRYIAKYPRECSSKERCQLISVTSLYLAVKLHDIRRKDTLEFFSKLSGGRFTTGDIEAMERKILIGLDWLMNPPTPQSFLYNYTYLLSTVIPTDMEKKVMTSIYEVANYITEVSLLQSSVSQEKASTLAFAAFLVAVREVKRAVLSVEHHKSIVSNILSLQSTAPDEVVAVADEIVETIQSNDGHLNLAEIYERLDPDGAIYNY